MALAADLIISEFLASNNNVLNDDYGRSSDWIEIYNAGSSAAVLTDHTLTDDPDETNKWTFPAGTTLAPGEFLVVFANDDEDPNDAFNLYTGFSLRASGEYVGLYDAGGTVLSEFGIGGANYPAQSEDISFGFAFESPQAGSPVDNSVTLIGLGDGEGNGSFEDTNPSTNPSGTGGSNRWAANGFGQVATIDGWSATWINGFIGWDDNAAANDGDNYGFVNDGSVAIFEADPVAVSLQEGETLDLSFSTVNNVIGGSAIYRVSLLFDNGSVVDFAPRELTETNGQYELQEFLHTVTSAEVGASEVTLRIELDNSAGGNDQPRFDSVELKQTPSRRVSLIESGSDARVFVPTDNSVDAVWTTPGFDDSGWFLGPTPFGYEDAPNPNAPTFEDLFVANGPTSDDDPDDLFNGTDLVDAGVSASTRFPTAYVRYEFNVENALSLDDLVLELQYEDGFVAYLNGQQVESVNAPQDPAFDSTTLNGVTNPDAEALQFASFSLADDLGKLVDGTNVLAIHVLNATANNDDLLINATLTANELLPTETWNTVEDFDGVTAPALPAGWETSLTTSNIWTTSATGAASGQNRVFVPNPGTTSDVTLTSPAFPVAENTSRFRFQNFYNTEATWDGGVLEVKIGDGEFLDILDNAVQGEFLAGGYNLDSLRAGPLAGRPAWSGNSGDYVQTVVQLPASAHGQDVQFRWRFSSDNFMGAVDWSIDTLEQVLIEPATRTTLGLIEPRLTGFLQTPTPGAINTNLRASGVAFSRASGLFSGSFDLTLTPDVPGEEIRFTIDGSVPDASSALYAGPITISESVEVRARAFGSLGQVGEVFGETYVELDTSDNPDERFPTLDGFTSSLPILVLDNYGAGNPLSRTFNNTYFSVYEPDEVTGLTTITDTSTPTVSTRAATHRRGSSSFNLGKNNFRLELRDQTDDDQSFSVLGLPPESDFILNTFARFDRALIRNPLAFDTNLQLDVYAPRTRYVEVFFNQDGDALEESDYFGVYVLQETIKRDDNRVDIANLEPDDADITGGYIIRSDRNQAGDPFFQTSRGFPSNNGSTFVIDEPNAVDLTPAQRAYIEGYVQDFEDALFGVDFKDSQGRSYEEFIDVDSFIDQHIFHLFFKDPDSLRFSSYFYKDRGGKLTAGPNWDQERIAGVETDTGTNRARNPENWYGDGSITELFEYDWWGRLFDDPNFMQRWIDRWEELRTTVYNDANINSLIDGYVAQLTGGSSTDNAVIRNFTRWGDDASNGSNGNNNNGGEAWPNARVPTSTDPNSNGFYQFADPAITQGFSDPQSTRAAGDIFAYWQSEVDHVRNWVGLRLDWVYGQLSEVVDFSLAEGPVNPGSQVNLVTPGSIAPGAQVWYTTDGSDPRDSSDGAKGQPSANAILWDGNPITISNTTRLTVRVLDDTIQNPKDQVLSRSNTFDIWSASTTALFEVGATVQDSLRITEINYHPHAPTAAELQVDPAFVDNDFEFIEVQNTSSTDPLDLSGTQLAGGVTFAFGSTTLQPGERALIVEDTAAFEARYGTGLNVLGQWSGALSNSGEKLTILDNQGLEVMEVTYNDVDPWPVAADGFGATLVLDAPADTPAAELGKYYRWRAGAEFGGTPGVSSAPSNGVVINEVVTNTELPQVDAIELFNPTGGAIDIGGWFLSDDGDDPFKFQIPTGTIIGDGQHLVFSENDFNPNPANPDPRDFALSDAGDEVFLVIPDSSGVSVETFVDVVAFGGALPGESLGRVGDGSGRLAPLSSVTLGAANSTPRIGPLILSEVNYHPSDPSQAALDADPNVTDNDLEFVEVHNPTDAAVDLTGWRLRGESDFDFASGASLAAGGSVVVVTFDPTDQANASKLAAFRAHYGIDTGVPLVGGLSGNLSNGFGRITLQRPNDGGFHTTEDEVLYDDLAPWPTAADGGGVSLQRLGVNLYGNAPSSWLAEQPTPGAADFAPNPIGDYDGSTVVDIGDFGEWASNFGSAAANADGNDDGVVNAADYVIWRDFVSPPQAPQQVAALSAPATLITAPQPATPVLAAAAEPAVNAFAALVFETPASATTPETDRVAEAEQTSTTGAVDQALLLLLQSTETPSPGSYDADLLFGDSGEDSPAEGSDDLLDFALESFGGDTKSTRNDLSKD